MKIAVLLGGNTSEREVFARAPAWRALSKLGYDVVLDTGTDSSRRTPTTP
jgi:hypothetical protein